MTERRRNVRHATVFQVAKMTTDTSEELCILRDVSSEGLKAEVYCELAVGDRIAIDLKTGHRVQGQVAWTREQIIGMAFDAAVPMLDMLAHCSFDDRVMKIRPPRLTMNMPGILRIDDDYDEIDFQLCDISQAGMKVLLSRAVRPGTTCLVKLDALEPRKAVVRWQRQGEAGILLLLPLSYGEFAAWRRALMRLHRADAEHALAIH